MSESETNGGNGWVKIHRCLWKNPRAHDPDWIAVWIYLLAHATHRPIGAIWRGERITLEPGQLITGRRVISAETGVQESKCKRVLTLLETEHQIDRQRSNRSSLISITNWHLYQSRDQQNDQPVTSQWPADDQQVTTNKKSKKLRNNILSKDNCPLGGLKDDPDNPNLSQLSLNKDDPDLGTKSLHEQVIDLYHKHAPSLPKARMLTPARKQAIGHRLREYKNDLRAFEILFQTAEASDFLSGRSGKWGGCNIDWLMKSQNMLKTLEGIHNNDRHERNERNRNSNTTTTTR